MAKEEKLSKIERMYKNLRKKPYYLTRALNPKTTTLNNQTVRLAQQDNIVYPLVRISNKPSGKGGTGNRMLKKHNNSEALAMASQKNDFIRFKTESDAKYFAKNFSNLITKYRNAK